MAYSSVLASRQAVICFLCQQFIVSDISDIGEEAIIMFEEEGGVGAEEVVGTEEFVTCFVDNSQVLNNNKKRNVVMIIKQCQIGESSGYQPIIVTSADQLGMVEEEVTTEIIKSEIQVGSMMSVLNR